jgi:glycosyltransferase involved in cell wall biosynthesis
MTTLPKYVLITPARNEAAFIELTLKSMVAQTAPPLKWVIVSDGSTDGTDELVSKYAIQHEWIELVRQPERTDRHFAGKVGAFNAGCARVAGLDYQVIGNLDADISFDEDYFAFLMSKFAENPKLGVAGTPYREGNWSYDYRYHSVEHVSGACQLFRRECFEEIGGYKPVKSGGIDLIAVLSARTKGWQTRSFPEKFCCHHRKMGGAQVAGLRERFHRGRMDYLLGGHPLWEIFRSLYQMRNKPYFLGGFLILAGYVWTGLSGAERTMPKELIVLRQNDQLRRLKNKFGLTPRSSAAQQ